MRVALELPEGLVITAPLPELVSQRTVLEVLAIPPTIFLELVRSTPLEVIKVGQLRLVDRVAFVAWLRERQRREGQPANDGADPDAGAHEVLAKINHVPVRRPAGRG